MKYLCLLAVFSLSFGLGAWFLRAGPTGPTLFDFRRIQIGMPEDEVWRILGQVATYHGMRLTNGSHMWGEANAWTWHCGDQYIRVEFEGFKVLRIWQSPEPRWLELMGRVGLL